MIWNVFYACLIGYIFGLFQTGYMYGKFKHIDIRNQGSGNAGTTNALRVLGWKAGLITFLGDAFKCILCCDRRTADLWRDRIRRLRLCMLCMPAWEPMFGHNYPFYMKFKGGKGIADDSRPSGHVHCRFHGACLPCGISHSRGPYTLCVRGVSWWWLPSI